MQMILGDDCELQDRYGNCTPALIAHLLEWLWVAAVLLVLWYTVAQGIRNRRHIPQHAPGYRVPAPQLAEDATEPRAATRVWAHVVYQPRGPLAGWLALVAAVGVPQQTTSSGFAALVAPKCSVEIRDLVSGKALVAYDWRRNSRGAREHARSLNDRARLMGLTSFLADLGVPALDSSVTDEA